MRLLIRRSQRERGVIRAGAAIRGCDYLIIYGNYINYIKHSMYRAQSVPTAQDQRQERNRQDDDERRCQSAGYGPVGQLSRPDRGTAQARRPRPTGVSRGRVSDVFL